MPGSAPSSRVRAVLLVLETGAVLAIGLGVLASAVTPNVRLASPVRLVGIAVLLAAPFAALGAAGSAPGASRSVRWFAIGALAVAAVGVWIAL
jgi:hypothetical protein